MISGLLIGQTAWIKLLDNLAYSYALQASMRPSPKREEAMKALEFLARLQTFSPDNPDWPMRIAEVHVNLEQWDNANQAYTEFIRLHGNQDKAMTRLRALAIYHNWCEVQEENLLKLATSLSQEAYAYRLYGDACITNGNQEAAIRAYHKAFALLPTSDLAIDLGWALFQQAEAMKSTEPQDALRDYEAVVRTFEQTPPVGQRAAQGYYILAWSYWQMNQFAKALASYDRCIDANHLYSREAYFCAVHLGSAYSQWLSQEERDYDKALAYYQRAEEIAPYNVNIFEVKLGEGRIWSQIGDYETALLFFQDAVRLQPNCLECGLALGDALVALGHTSDAQNQYQVVLQRFPEDQRAAIALEKLEGQQ